MKTDDPLAQLAQIAHRLFPFARGLFEDKVASFWCTLHSIVKLKNILSPEIQLKLATGTTLVSGMVKILSINIFDEGFGQPQSILRPKCRYDYAIIFIFFFITGIMFYS